MAGTVWDFNAVTDSPKYAPRTLDWHAGDRIDLSDVPLAGAGHPASLHWAGVDPAGSKAWGVWEWGDGSGTLRVDVDGDSTADMSIVLRGRAAAGGRRLHPRLTASRGRGMGGAARVSPRRRRQPGRPAAAR